MGRKTHYAHGGARKIGNQKVHCQIYLCDHRREKNKIKKIEKYLKVNPNDLEAVKRLEELGRIIGG